MRLFVALPLHPAAAEHLETAVAPVRDEHPALRWVQPPRRHLTLAFLGEVGEPEVPGLAGLIGQATARQAPFATALAGAGRFGDRVLWVGVAGDVEALGRLAASVAGAARAAGVAVEDQRFRAHVTLARGRGGAGLAGPAAGLAGYAGPAWTAGRVELVSSHLGGEPAYETLSVARLGAAAPVRGRGL